MRKFSKNIIAQIDWEKGNDLMPAIIQHVESGQVLMLGFMNREALQKTLVEKQVWFYSRTKKRLWKKGESSGDVLNVVNIAVDCDQDALLIQATPSGPTCHTGKESCFEEGFSDQIAELYDVIQDRKNKMPSNSYTASLFKEGLGKICEKVAEESEEVIRAAKQESKKRVIEESVDVLYHLLVLLTQQKVQRFEWVAEIRKRKKE